MKNLDDNFIYKSEVSDEERQLLSEYINKIKMERNLGFNQLAIKSKLNVRVLNDILYGKSRRTNPFFLQRLGYALRIDYKDLYKIVGYLTEDDFNEAAVLKKENEELKKKLKECESINVHNITNHGNQVIGFNSVINSDNNKKNGEELDISGLSEEKIIELKKFIKYLKASD